MNWWNKNTLRLVQNNLRMEDASLDRKELMENLMSFHANALLLNTGGLVSFYPTDLSYQMRSPYLKGDLTGDMVRSCHDQGMKFIARFDFSKLPKAIMEKHPDWAYLSPKGATINYNGMLHTCINSPYQRDLTREVLGEVIDRYPIDGVFFNMFGFITRDYSNTYHGICHCKNCQDAYMKRFARELPTEERDDDENFVLYKQFKQEIIDQRLKGIYEFVKSKNPSIAVCNYAEKYVDIVMHESNTEIHRPYPLWEYSASENIMKVEGTYPDKTSGNISINAVGLDYRFQGVSPHEIAVRLFQSLAAGGQLLYCIIGTWQDYPDKKNFPTVRNLYAFHERNEQFFGTFESEAQITLIYPTSDSSQQAFKEFRGIFRMLKEEHLQFKVINQVAFTSSSIGNCEVILVPDVLPSPSLLNQLKASEKPVVWTGSNWINHSDPSFLSFFGIEPPLTELDGRWSYVQTSGKGYFDQTEWVFLDNTLVSLTAKDALLESELISAGRIGPPERCGGNFPTGKFLVAKAITNQATMMGFHPGVLYLQYGFEEHKQLLLEQIKEYLGKAPLETDAPFNIEVTLNRYPDTHTLNVCLTNLSGFNGSSFHSPNKQGGFCIEIPSPAKRHTVESLYEGCLYDWTTREGKLIITVETLGSFAILLIREESS